MAEMRLVNVKKIYPFSGDDIKKQRIKEAKARKRAKKGIVEEHEEKKVNLQVTEKGVVAVQEFNLDVKDKEFIIMVGPSG